MGLRYKNILPTAVPQGLVSVVGPEHGIPQELPPTQERVLVCVPIPHLTEHALHAPNGLHFELTEIVHAFK